MTPGSAAAPRHPDSDSTTSDSGALVTRCESWVCSQPGDLGGTVRTKCPPGGRVGDDAKEDTACLRSGGHGRNFGGRTRQLVGGSICRLDQRSRLYGYAVGFRRGLCHTEEQSRHVDLESVVPWTPSGHPDGDVGDALACNFKALVRLPGG